jgi:hypothetical protein
MEKINQSKLAIKYSQQIMELGTNEVDTVVLTPEEEERLSDELARVLTAAAEDLSEKKLNYVVV